MIETFIWPVNTDASGGGEFLMDKAQFGDGYTQEVAKGLNNEKQMWRVTYNGYKSAVLVVLNFIRARKGEMFYWTPPLGVQGVYRCKKYDPQLQGGGYYTLSLEFEQVFLP